MTELLQKAIERLRALPDEEQDHVAAQILEHLGGGDGHASENAEPTEERPIWEAIQERTRPVPDEAWDAFPINGAAGHDHYLYGTPKKEIR